MSHALAQVADSSPAVFTWREREDLTTLADVHGLAVGIIDDVAYVGFSHVLASWTIERVSEKFLTTRIADGMGRRCSGWQIAVRSVEDAMTRIVADSEAEGSNR